MSRSHPLDFDLNTVTGLSEKEVAERLRRDGPNELPSAKQRGLFAIAAGVAHEPMFLLLLVGGAIYFLLGDAQREPFLFAKLHRDSLALCLGAGSVSVLWFEVFKIIRRRK